MIKNERENNRSPIDDTDNFEHIGSDDAVSEIGASSNQLPARTGTTKVQTSGADPRWTRSWARLRSLLGEDVMTNWFASVELEAIENGTVKLSVATSFLRNWIKTHYTRHLVTTFNQEYGNISAVSVVVRQAGLAMNSAEAAAQQVEELEVRIKQQYEIGEKPAGKPVAVNVLRADRGEVATEGGGFQGSPLDRKLLFANYEVGNANRLAQAAAMQVAESYSEQPVRFNPLYIHGGVGLGKTHLLNSIAWEVKRRNPSAQVLYLTAERFRYKFVAALRSQDPLSFKEKLRTIDMLIVDDMEFLQGEKTEQEFDHTLNSLLDGGKQVVVASARAASQLDKLDTRMRSRLSGGLVAEISPLEYELRLRILERRVAEKMQIDPNFQVPDDVLEYLAERLTESGRELDGAVTRLHAASQLTRTAITLDSAEHIMRDLVRGAEPRRIKVEDIIRVVSKHYGVTRGDIISERRHRAVVWPRQIGMYLAKTLTARSLPDIGSRFGGRDHTTVLHAIRKVQAVIDSDPRQKEEIEDLKRLLMN